MGSDGFTDSVLIILPKFTQPCGQPFTVDRGHHCIRQDVQPFFGQGSTRYSTSEVNGMQRRGIGWDPRLGHSTSFPLSPRSVMDSTSTTSQRLPSFSFMQSGFHTSVIFMLESPPGCHTAGSHTHPNVGGPCTWDIP
jgi:hypothetical protein